MSQINYSNSDNDDDEESNITLFFNEKENNNNENVIVDFGIGINIDIDNILKEFENIELNNSDKIFSEGENYKMNFTTKELLIICDYYGLLKKFKINTKTPKDILIMFIVEFENDNNNFNIVNERKKLWYFIETLKNNKFMKKYVIW